MASRMEFVEFIADQLKEAGAITCKKMFGEYGVYCEGKIFAVICDDQFFIKITEAGRKLCPDLPEAPPYKGAKNYFLVEDVEDREKMVRLAVATCGELPTPKAKKKKREKGKYQKRSDERMAKPVIALTMGDPAGIGPEIIVKALANHAVREHAVCIVIGDRKVLGLAMETTGMELEIHKIGKAEEARDEKGVLNLIDLDNVDMGAFAWGKASAMCGRAAYGYIEKSIQLANKKEVDAVSTAPINKEAFHEAKIPYIGHTELFGALTETKDPLTMFETNGMRVFFLTRHVSMRKMLDLVKKDRIVDYVIRCEEALKRLGVSEGTMAIAGLNPHSGEHGLFGEEETLEIEPAVRELRAMGYDVAGPVGADSVFHQCATGKYNSVLSLYHDQGHIAAKTLDFDRTIAITNGMPILRTSVDHGTAFDIAGTGTAGAVSMAEAILLAARYSPCFRDFTPKK